jgi:predicted molibdopterin-dependent oxidoreductase YjgC
MPAPAEPGTVTITLDGLPLSGAAGATVASLLLANAVRTLRRSPRAGTPRGAFCLMGVCQECLVVIDGTVRQACLVAARDGMQVSRPNLVA